MFGLMTRREHEDLMLSMECELQYQQQKNQILAERIQLGEDYRGRMEREISSVKAKNRELVHKVDAQAAAFEDKSRELEMLLAERDKRIRELELMLGSYEARWEIRKSAPGAEEEPIPRRAPLARDDRRREVCA